MVSMVIEFLFDEDNDALPNVKEGLSCSRFVYLFTQFLSEMMSFNKSTNELYST